MCRMTFAGFYRLGAVAPERCRPFDVDREGILTGEGQACSCWSRLDAAVARGARIYAEVLGYGLNCDAGHPVAPNQDSRRALHAARARRRRRRSRADVDLISAHGTGTKANDVTGVRRDPRRVRSRQAAHDLHQVNAGAHDGRGERPIRDRMRDGDPRGIHPADDQPCQPRPECDIDCVPNAAIDARLRIVQNNALAFAGNNAVLILGEYGSPQ